MTESRRREERRDEDVVSEWRYWRTGPVNGKHEPIQTAGGGGGWGGVEYRAWGVYRILSVACEMYRSAILHTAMRGEMCCQVGLSDSLRWFWFLPTFLVLFDSRFLVLV